MNFLTFKFLYKIGLVIIMFVLGIILTKTGKPYNSVLSTFHKVIAFILLILICFEIINFIKINKINSIQIILIILFSLTYIISFISGVLCLSLKETRQIILYIHRITPFISIILGLITLVILNIKK